MAAMTMGSLLRKLRLGALFLLAWVMAAPAGWT